MLYFGNSELVVYAQCLDGVETLLGVMYVYGMWGIFDKNDFWVEEKKDCSKLLGINLETPFHGNSQFNNSTPQ